MEDEVKETATKVWTLRERTQRLIDAGECPPGYKHCQLSGKCLECWDLYKDIAVLTKA